VAGNYWNGSARNGAGPIEEADAWARGRIAGRAWCEENQEHAMSWKALDALPQSAAAAVSDIIDATATALGASEEQFIYAGGFVQTLIKRLHFIGASFASCEALTPLRSPASLSGALSREPEFATRSPEVTARAHTAVAARNVRNASSLRTRSVLRDVRWRWTLNVLWTAA